METREGIIPENFFEKAQSVKRVFIPVHSNVATGLFVPIDVKLFKEYITELQNSYVIRFNFEIHEENSALYIIGIGKEKKTNGKK